MNFFSKSACVSATLSAAVLLGCTQRQQSPQDLKEQAAKDTATLKQDAKAVAQGIREGWNRDKAIDLNSASKDQLMSLPGMTSAKADRLVAGRPYSAPEELVTKHIMNQAEYDKIADRVTAKN